MSQQKDREVAVRKRQREVRERGLARDGSASQNAAACLHHHRGTLWRVLLRSLKDSFVGTYVSQNSHQSYIVNLRTAFGIELR